MADNRERRSTPRKAATATPKPDTRAAAPRSASTFGSTPMASARADISSDDIRRQIAEAAYLRAKERGFEPGHELEDWVEAESEVMGRIAGAER